MFHILVLLVSWLTWGTVDLINTNAYSVSSSATMIEMTFEDYAHNQGVDDITLTNLIVNADFIVLNNQTLKEVFEDGQLVLGSQFTTDTNADGIADNWTNHGNLTALSVVDEIQNFTGSGVYTVTYLNRLTQNNIYTVIGNQYYTFVNAKRNNSAVNNKIYVSQMGGNLIKQIDLTTEYAFYSVIYAPASISQTHFALSADVGLQVSVDYVGAVNLTSLGISNLSQTELDTLYLYYQALKNDVSLGISKIDVIDDVSYYTNDLIILELGTTPIYTKSQLDDIIAYYGYFEGEQTFLNINHTDFDTIYTEFFGTASTVFLDNYDTTAYIDLTTTYNDIVINDIGVMLIFLLGYLTVIHIVKEYL